MAIDKIASAASLGQTGSVQQAQTNKVAENIAPAANVQRQVISQTSGNYKDGSKEGKRETSAESIKKAVSDLNKKMSNTTCQFGIHEGTNRVTVKIIDKETKDVIKEYPAEETLEMIEKVWELAGIMVDKKL